MLKDTRRSGLSLVLAGLTAMAFFLLTDPRWGAFSRHGADVVDGIMRASPGTWIGVAGSLAIAGIGVWLMIGRAA